MTVLSASEFPFELLHFKWNIGMNKFRVQNIPLLFVCYYYCCCVAVTGVWNVYESILPLCCIIWNMWIVKQKHQYDWIHISLFAKFMNDAVVLLKYSYKCVLYNVICIIYVWNCSSNGMLVSILCHLDDFTHRIHLSTLFAHPFTVDDIISVRLLL